MSSDVVARARCPRPTRAGRRWLGTLLATVAALAGVLTTSACGTAQHSTSTHATARVAGQGARTASGGATDPATGLAWINESALPSEAAHTLSEIRAGGPYDYPRNDGVVYHNNNRVLPRERDGYYHEYTVRTPGASTRGARRIIAGSDGELYWTGDHYNHFDRIKEGA